MDEALAPVETHRLDYNNIPGGGGRYVRSLIPWGDTVIGRVDYTSSIGSIQYGTYEEYHNHSRVQFDLSAPGEPVVLDEVPTGRHVFYSTIEPLGFPLIRVGDLLIDGKQVAEGVELYIAAASEPIQQQAEKSGAWGKLVAAGAIALPPGDPQWKQQLDGLLAAMAEEGLDAYLGSRLRTLSWMLDAFCPWRSHVVIPPQGLPTVITFVIDAARVEDDSWLDEDHVLGFAPMGGQDQIEQISDCILGYLKGGKGRVGIESGMSNYLPEGNLTHYEYQQFQAALADAELVNAHTIVDALAADSVRYAEMTAQASWTKPSFATIFTSLYPSSHTATGPTTSGSCSTRQRCVPAFSSIERGRSGSRRGNVARPGAASSTSP